jgi:hypothetical protein
VHFLRNALDYVPRKVDDDCLREVALMGKPAFGASRSASPLNPTDLGNVGRIHGAGGLI